MTKEDLKKQIELLVKDDERNQQTIINQRQEIERLNNIIKEVEKRLEQGIEDNKKEYNLKSQMAVFVLRDTLELIEELIGSNKENVWITNKIILWIRL